MTKNNLYICLLTILIYFSFFFGYFFQENSAGGGFVDFQHIANNILLFKESNIFEINWMKYESTSLPIYYLIIKILNIFDNLKIGLFNLIISLSSTFIFFKLLLNLSKKYNLKIYNNLLFAISSLPLLSPYFRTSTFWMLEENIGYFFMLSSIFFWTKEKTYLNNFFCVIFSSLAFYSRQSYAFICVIIFFSLINFKVIFTKKNFFIILIFLFSLTPSLFFFFEWKGLIPPYAATDRSITFKFINLLIIFSICFFYLLPFLIIEDRSLIKDFFKKNYKFLIFFFILFFLFFFNKIQLDDVYFKFKLGGGIIYKLVFHINYLFESFLLKKICFLILSYFGLILVFFFAFKSYELKIFFFIFFLIFSNANIVFQEYFDPMIFFLVIIFYKIKDQNCNFINLFYFLFCYNLTLLVSNLIYYNIILML
jgi:hypothetical protein